MEVTVRLGEPDRAEQVRVGERGRGRVRDGEDAPLLDALHLLGVQRRVE